MAIAIAAEQALKGRRIIKSLGTGEEHWRTDFIGKRGDGEISNEPQAFLIEMHANESILPHFHAVDQFQVFVAGSGGLGRTEVGTVAVHYVDHHTGYGPINAGAHGYSYFTLRAKTDSGAKYLHRPGYREALKPSRKRHGTSAGLALSTAPVLMSRTDVQVENLFPDIDSTDGLGASLYRMGPGLSAPGPDPSRTGGQYFLVVNGAMELDAARYATWSTVFVSSGEPAPDIRAGSEGLEVLLLQFAEREALPRSA
jgi:hypothetical protein